MSSPVSPDPSHPTDPDARPRPLAQRLGLLVLLLVVPMAAVTLPSVVLTHVFGQRPRPKAAAVLPTPTPDTTGLRRQLDLQATGLLPTPAPLTGDPIHVPVHDPSHVGPRAEKIKAQAQRFGGTAVEGLAAEEGEKHLFVDLPAGMADAFRRAVDDNTPVETLPTPAPSPSSATATARDQVEVFIRAMANDE